MFKVIQGMEGVDRKGRRIVAAHTYNAFGQDTGYGVLAQCENYSAGRTVKTWRHVTTGQTKAEAIAKFQGMAA